MANGDSLFDIHTITKIPSGVFVFDYLTAGGIPESRIVTMWGVKATGKTTMTLRIAHNYLNMYPDMRVVFTDFESAFDWEWGKHFLTDEDLKRFDLVTPDYGEQGIGIMKEIAMADDVGLMIVDSVSMMTPLGEFEAAPEASTMSLHTKLVNRMYRYLIPIITRARKVGRKLTVIAINQPIMDIGKRSFAPIMKKTGGMRQDCISSMDIKFRPGQAIKSGKTPIKLNCPFTVEKTKCGGLAHRSGEFLMYVVEMDGKKVGEPDEDQVVLTYAKRTGVLSKEGTKWKGLGYDFNNLAEVLSSFGTDRALFEKFKHATLKSLLEQQTILEEGDSDGD